VTVDNRVMPKTPSQPTPARAQRILAALVTGFAIWALVIVVTGGVDLRPFGLSFRSHDPLRPIILAFAGALAYAWLLGQALEARAAAAWAFAERWGLALALILSAVTLLLGLRYGTHVAGGADPYGYVSQADLWLRGALTTEQPLAGRLPWEHADWTLSPLGYRPSPTGGAIVPTYAPGLPILMALCKAIVGACGPYLVVPILGALTVFLTYVLGRKLTDAALGLAAASLLAASPAFLFMLMFPMSDVAVAAFFAAATVIALSDMRARSLWTGLALAVAMLIRPNLLPLAGIYGVYVCARAGSWRARVGEVALFAAGMLPSVIAIAWIHHTLYGSPLKSGYGTLSELYGWQHLWPNLSRYPRWLIETQTPLIGAMLIPLLRLRPFEEKRQPALVFLAAVTLGGWLSYLWYIHFQEHEWWYLRFLLPVFPAMLVMAAMGCRALCTRVRPRCRAVVLAGLYVSVLAYQIGRVQDLAILRLWEGETVYPSVARYVERSTPPNAVLVSMLHSGSLRYYTGRLTLRYDWVGRDWWPRGLDTLSALGYRPYVVLSEFEEADFRRRFGFSGANGPGRLVAELVHPSRVRVYDPLSLEGTNGPETISPTGGRDCRPAIRSQEP
jgi:hypothetical protein